MYSYGLISLLVRLAQEILLFVKLHSVPFHFFLQTPAFTNHMKALSSYRCPNTCEVRVFAADAHTVSNSSLWASQANVLPISPNINFD